MSEHAANFRVSADASGFEKGMAQAQRSLKGLKHELHEWGGGRLGHVIGIYGVIEGFKKVYESAQEARKKAEEFGNALDPSVRRVAEIADGWDAIKHSIGEAAVGVLGVIATAGEGWGTMINDLLGRSRESQNAAKSAAEGARKQEENLAKLRKEYSEKARGWEEEIKKTRHENYLNTLTEEGKLNEVKKERHELEKRLLEMDEKTPARLKVELELEKLKTEEQRAQDAVDKEQEENHKKHREMQKRIFEEHQEYQDEQERDEKELARLKFEALKPEQQITELQKQQTKLEAKIADEKLHAINSISDQIELQKNLNEQAKIEAEIKKDEKKTVHEITEEVKRHLAELNRFSGYGKLNDLRGHGQFSNASDEALSDFIHKKRAEAATNKNPSNWGGGSGFFQELFAARSDLEADNAQKELNWRKGIRQQVKLGGVELARRQFNGDPLQFDQSLQLAMRGGPDQSNFGKIADHSAKTTQTLETISKQLSNAGIT